MYHKLKSNIWCMVSEIWSATYRIFSHFGPFSPFYPPPLPLPNNLSKSKFQKKWKKKNTWRYHHSTHLHHKWILLDVWFLRYGAQLTELFLILGHFLPFYPTNNQKNQNFEKNKKKAWRYIILHKCNKNHDHMLYCSWDMALDGCNCYFSYWAIFRHFTSLTPPEN